MGSGEMQVPEPYSTIIDEICAEDAKWFKEHPGVAQRVREARDGEFWPLLRPSPPTVLIGVRVTLLGDGLRTREPILNAIPEDGIEVWEGGWGLSSSEEVERAFFTEAERLLGQGETAGGRSARKEESDV